MVVLQEKTKTHSDCFAAMNVDADQSWLGKLRPSAVAAFRLLEAFFYMGCVGKFVVLFGCGRWSQTFVILTGSCLQEDLRPCLEGTVQSECGSRCCSPEGACAKIVAGDREPSGGRGSGGQSPGED